MHFITGTSMIQFIILPEGNYIVHYNFCEYQDKKLYLRYNDPYSKKTLYHVYVASRHLIDSPS